MRAILNAFRAERIKSRRTALFFMGAIFPFACILMAASFFLFRQNLMPDTQIMFPASTIAIWSRMMQPLFAVMVALGCYQTEHNAGMWKHLNSMPTRGVPQIVAKHMVAWLGVILATSAIVLGTAGSLLLLKLARVDLDLTYTAPMKALLARGVLLILVSGLSIVSPLMIAASRARRALIGTTLGLGAALTVMGNSIFELKDVISFVPWSAGVVWSELLERDPTPGLAHLTLAVVALPVWLASSLAVHIALEKQRPHF